MSPDRVGAVKPLAGVFEFQDGRLPHPDKDITKVVLNDQILEVVEDGPRVMLFRITERAQRDLARRGFGASA